MLTDGSWLKYLSNFYALFEAGGCYDHVRLSWTQFTNFSSSGIYYLHTKTFCLQKRTWTRSLFHSTAALYCMIKKLKRLKFNIRLLNHGNLTILLNRHMMTFEDLYDKQNMALRSLNKIKIFLEPNSTLMNFSVHIVTQIFYHRVKI